MIVEDEGITALSIKDSLEEMGYEVSSIVNSGEEAVRKASEDTPGLILMDISLGGKIDGIEAVALIQKQFNIPVVYVTANSDLAIIERTKSTGPFGFIVKPFEDRELRIAVEIALYKHRAEEELRMHRDHLMELVEERTVELQKSNESLLEANELMENVFSNVHVLIAYMDTDFNFIRVNRKYAESDGKHPELYIGKNYFDLFPNEENEAIFRQVVRTGRPYFLHAKPFRYAHNPERGTTFWDWSLKPTIDTDGNVSGLILSLMDVTDNITMYGELMRSDHLASIGKLAAGVAHEINNPVNGIINYAQLLQNKSMPGSQEADVALRIIKESDRIANIVRSLLSFARDNKGEKSPVHVKEILSDALSLIGVRLRKSGIRINAEIARDLPLLHVNKQQIEQVFLNFISNSIYALDEKYPQGSENKLLEIYGEEIMKEGPPLIRLTFHDRGTGIPSDMKDKIINPFVSTKTDGAGTGLGLSISHGIIADHGGKMSIDSVEGEFTTVTIELPAYKG